MTNEEIIAFLKVHLQSIQDNDVQTYNETTAEDLTLYEWWVTPHRIDGLPFQIAGQGRGVGDGVCSHGEATNGLNFQIPDQVEENFADEGQTLRIVGSGPAINIVWTLQAAHQLERFIGAVPEGFFPEEFQELLA